MASLNFLSENLVTNGSTALSIITGTENAQFPLSNILKTFTTKVFRSVGNTVEILIDLQQTKTITTVAVVGHALDGLGYTTAELRGSATTDFSSSVVQTIDLSAENNFGYKFFTGVAARYWKLTLTNTGSFCELSNIFLGTREELTQNSFSIRSFRFVTSDNSDIEENDFGQKFIDVKNRIKEMRGTIEAVNTAEFDILDALTARHGESIPLWIIPDPNNTIRSDGEFRFSMYCYFERIRGWQGAGASLFNQNFRFRQVV